MTNETNVVGQSVSRIDAVAKVTGAALFPGDLEMPGILHMKILFAERPHARIVRLDTSRAEAYPGVVAVLTAKDVPVLLRRPSSVAGLALRRASKTSVSVLVIMRIVGRASNCPEKPKSNARSCIMRAQM